MTMAAHAADTAITVLLVDDERTLREPLVDYLVGQGFVVLEAESAAAARSILREKKADLALVDIMMPGEDGLSLTRHLIETQNLPTILLTAMGEATDRIVGLEIGADDYVTKPFEPRELLARVRALLRRPGVARAEEPDSGFAFAGWRLDVQERRLRDPAGRLVALSEGEHALLAAFVERPGRADDGGPGRTAPALDFMAQAEGVSYPAAPVRGLGRTTARLVARVSVTGQANYAPEAMARWRDSGGTLEVKRFTLNHGPLALDGDGTLAIDNRMRPIGAFTLRVKGFEEALDRLAGAGVIKPHPAALAKTVMKALARKQGMPGAEELKVPLSLQDGRLYVGPVALAKLPPIRWP